MHTRRSKNPRRNSYFADQFAFRPTVLTAALFHAMITMLSTNSYTCPSLCTGFFNIFNWIKHFFDGRTKCTKYSNELSTYESIKASVIQGSGLGPATATYLVTASDM